MAQISDQVLHRTTGQPAVVIPAFDILDKSGRAGKGQLGRG
jgi:hypothetical protein